MNELLSLFTQTCANAHNNDINRELEEATLKHNAYNKIYSLNVCICLIAA